MINLLPIEEKKNLTKEFNFRVVSFYFFTVAICFLIGAIALLPSYFFFSLKETIASNKLEAIKALPLPVSDKENTNIIKDTNKKITTIENTEKTQFSVLDKVINEIISKKMPDIKLNFISYNIDKEGVKQITLKGIAPDRERLLVFRRALENDTLFSKVDLPISNFIKGSNIDFNMNVTSF